MSNRREPHKQRTSEKIQNAMIVDRLVDHFNGRVELSQSQVNVGLGLIKKYLPDIKAIEHGGEVKHDVDVSLKSAGNIAKAIAKAITG